MCGEMKETVHAKSIERVVKAHPSLYLRIAHPKMVRACE